MQTPVDPKTPISVTLLAEEWNIVLECLGDGRFRIVGPLIQKIVEQAQNPRPDDEARPRPHLQPAG